MSVFLCNREYTIHVISKHQLEAQECLLDGSSATCWESAAALASRGLPSVKRYNAFENSIKRMVEFCGSHKFVKQVKEFLKLLGSGRIPP